MGGLSVAHNGNFTNPLKLRYKLLKELPIFRTKSDTEKIVNSLMKKNEKIELINFDKNSGVGAALIAGYNYCYEKKYDIAVVMPGDAQALPVDFDKLIEPVVSGKADYAKGNRLKHKNVKEIMPRHRFIGNTFLTILTKFATGYLSLIHI